MGNMGYAPHQVHYRDPFRNLSNAVTGTRDTILGMQRRELERNREVRRSLDGMEAGAIRADARAVDEKQRNILMGTDKNLDPMALYGDVKQFNNPYEQADAEYQKAIALLPGQGLTDKRNPDGSVARSPEREALDRIHEENVSRLNTQTVSAFDTAQQAPADAEEYANRIYTEQLRQGVPMEQAKKLRDQVILDNTPTISEADKFVREQNIKAAENGLNNAQEIARINRVTVQEGTGSGGSNGRNGKKSSVSATPDKNLDAVVASVQKYVPDDMFTFLSGSAEAKDIPQMFGDLASRELPNGGYITGEALRAAALAAIEQGGLITDNHIDEGKFRQRVAAIAETAALNGDGRGGNGREFRNLTYNSNSKEGTRFLRDAYDNYSKAIADNTRRAPTVRERLAASNPMGEYKPAFFSPSEAPRATVTQPTTRPAPSAPQPVQDSTPKSAPDVKADTPVPAKSVSKPSNVRKLLSKVNYDTSIDSLSKEDKTALIDNISSVKDRGQLERLIDASDVDYPTEADQQLHTAARIQLKKLNTRRKPFRSTISRPKEDAVFETFLKSLK